MNPSMEGYLPLLITILSSLGGTTEGNRNNRISSHLQFKINSTFIEELRKNCQSLYCNEQVQCNSICVSGCDGWERGLREGCGIVCNGSSGNFREFHACQIGCSKIIEDYYYYVSGIVDIPEPPTLISDSLNYTSLGLSWEGRLDSIPFLIFTLQKRHFLRNEPWETLPTQSTNQTSIWISELKPYTEYQFRVGWIIAQDFPPLFSEPSHPIRTLAKGLPNSPQITSIQPISKTSVSVTWLPPSQPNGPLIAYALKLKSLPNGHLIIKEIRIEGNEQERGYTFSNLLPTTNYSLAISGLNREGEGNQTFITFFTPQSHISNDISKTPEPKLLIQGVRDVYVQALDLLLEPEVSVFVSNENVTGMSPHFRKNLVFIATADGEVIQASLGPTNKTKIIIRKNTLDIHVSFLSVDWLHDKIYFVGKRKGYPNVWSIRRTNLNGGRIQSVLPNIRSKPLDFMADPYTGYLYWVSRKPVNSTGLDVLYKMDMKERGSFGTPIIPVLEEVGLGPFTIDFLNYRILIVQKENNTVLSVTLDGETSDIRSNTQSPNFKDVLSIGSYGGLFYWITTDSVVVEEYNEDQDSYYHNSYEVAEFHRPSARLLILHPSLQPIPAPMAPPVALHALFSQERARVQWAPPPQIAGLGEGSWRHWNYELRISPNASYSQINETEFLVENLQPSTQYKIQVFAYSSSGSSPLSVPFHGKTLSPSNFSFYWGSDAGLYSTDPLGHSLQSLLFNPINASSPVISIAIAPNSTFIALQNGSIFRIQSSTLHLLEGISYANSIGWDSIGQKLYWSNPKKQAILRGSVPRIGEPMNPEWLPIITTAQEILIDSERALLIWTTGHSIESSKLNGHGKKNLTSVGLFSGIRILSISIDSQGEQLFWLRRSSAGSSIFQMNYLNEIDSKNPILVKDFKDEAFGGPIRYFSNRILLLENGYQAVVHELSGQDSTVRIDSIGKLNAVVIEDALAKSELGYNVTPPSVSPWSISITGKWDSFDINWDPVEIRGRGPLFYEVSVNNFNLQATSASFISIENKAWNTSTTRSLPHFPPYSTVEVSVTASVYWGSSEPTVVKRRTPSGKPSEPRNPRIFLKKLNYPYKSLGRETIEAQIRWEVPSTPNGVILGYLVHSWREGIKISNSVGEVDAGECNAEIKNLESGTNYEFGIEAYTEGGIGKMSRRIKVKTENGNPVPILLLTAGNQVEVMDVDRNSVQVMEGPIDPHSSTYFSLDKSLFWIEGGQFLMRSSRNGTKKSRILTFKDSVGSNLAVNWISRKLFWVSKSRDEKYWIERLDLVRGKNSERILSSTTLIKSITINPFTSSILWTTARSSGVVSLYSSQDDGSSTRSFLSRLSSCNCSGIHSIGGPVSFDGNGIDGGPPRGILFTDHRTIWLADEEGCRCFPQLNLTRNPRQDLIGPPFQLTSDRSHVYWLSERGLNGYGLYAGQKGADGGITLLSTGNGPPIREVKAIGTDIQPFPGRNCLIPAKLEVAEPLLLNSSAYSLRFRLPQGEILNCSLERVSLPSDSYSVYYGRVDENGMTECSPTSRSSCRLINQSSSIVQISDLHPYTSYTVFITLSSYYGEMEGRPSLVSSPVIFSTPAGAPMPPKLLQLLPLSPSRIQVSWAEPEKLNGGKVWYAVEWEEVGSKGRPTHVWGATNATSNLNKTEFRLNLTELKPGADYEICVVAYSELGDVFTKSELKKVRTIGSPNNLRLLQSTPHTITLSWTPRNHTQIIKHSILYRLGWSSEWNETGLIEGTIGGRIYKIHLNGLKPKTIYGFRLQTWYKGDPSKSFLWPREGHFKVDTLADKPGPPGVPILRPIKKSTYEISWEKSEENGARLDYYSLECLHYPISLNEQKSRKRRESDPEVPQKYVSSLPEKNPTSTDWVVIYNGTDSRWKVSGLDPNGRYSFRVRSRNLYGWSPYSPSTGILSLNELILLASEPQSLVTVFGLVALALSTLSGFGILLIYVYRRKEKEKPSLEQSPSNLDRREVELATLRELPGGVHQNNILYAADFILDIDSESLPIQKVKRHQITLLTHLGSGAFGDVYEGYASNMETELPVTSPMGTRVAIKTLRKGATTKEKVQFVEEARLMAQFKHPHILELLGICLDSDPCLILELMSGGDLLSHLRSSRLNPNQLHPSFTLGDLLEISLHVSKGCVYLEEKHFVHRDLAARNCLVRLIPSQHGSVRRMVKIGDFGLARDVYRNDYYRKEGEGLLPVRWMPPESLVDGVFTTQSDVWSFGVLLWEIFTLGHQPYPARSNVEVLNYVRNGGRLHEPPNSTPQLKWLMSACWEYNPQNRPTFRECLLHLERTMEDYEREMEGNSRLREGPHYVNRISTEAPSEDPLDEFCPVFLPDSPPSDEQGQFEFYSDGTEPPFPKYLELVRSESERERRPSSRSEEFNDGYEVPIPRRPRKPDSFGLSLSPPSSDSLGLPSPPPAYSNTRKIQKNPYLFFPIERQVRTLLSSSTSEDDYYTERKESTKYMGPCSEQLYTRARLIHTCSNQVAALPATATIEK